jgi:glycine cleavage system H protein
MANIKYSKSHEWAKIDGNSALIGITDHAQHALGDIVFIELPSVGSKVKQGSQFGTIESTKAASELFSPVSGTVSQINKELINNPQWVNQEPFDKGWMIKVTVENSKELDSLMDEAAYKEFAAKEAH